MGRLCSRVLVATLLTALSGCSRVRPGSPAERPACPKEPPAPPVLPFERAEHAAVDFWLDRLTDPDARLLDTEQIAELNRRIEQLSTAEGYPVGRWQLLHRPVDQQALDGLFSRQAARLRRLVREQKRMHLDGSSAGAMVARLLRVIAGSRATDQLRIAHRETPLRCLPSNEGMYDEAWQAAFDLLQCSQLRYGEPVRVLRQTDKFWYVWATYAEGWVDPTALTPVIGHEQMRAYVEPEAFVVLARDRVPLYAVSPTSAAAAEVRGGDVHLGDTPRRVAETAQASRNRWLGFARTGLRLSLAETTAGSGGRILVFAPSPTGLVQARLGGPGRSPPVSVVRPLTRRSVIRMMFAELNAPYGWGGTGGHRDCSRMLMDIFSAHGLYLPRNSYYQAQAGFDTVDVEKFGDAEKKTAILAAARRGLLLLYLPGHIMLYLGQDGAHLYALHQFSGYLVPCNPSGPGEARETMFRVNRTAVTSLELGRGSSRRGLLERITRLVIIGPPARSAGPATRPAPATEPPPSTEKMQGEQGQTDRQ